MGGFDGISVIIVLPGQSGPTTERSEMMEMDSGENMFSDQKQVRNFLVLFTWYDLKKWFGYGSFFLPKWIKRLKHVLYFNECCGESVGVNKQLLFHNFSSFLPPLDAANYRGKILLIDPRSKSDQISAMGTLMARAKISSFLRRTDQGAARL